MIKHIVSFSGGKDSTAMLLMMLEKGMQVDDIVFMDTGVEFPEMYEHIRKIEKYINRSITKLKAEKSFEYMLFEYEKKKGKNKGQKGYSFPDFRNRWCTQYFKKSMIKRYIKENYKDFEIIEYHGIAVDEVKRLEKNKEKNIKYPLANWGITEQEALEYCYSKGFNWNGLYKKFHRVSCWCCPLKSLKELKILYKEYPEYFKKIEEWESKTYRKFRADYSIKELKDKFNREIGRKKMREIKFRAWDKLNKEMFNVEIMDFQKRQVYKDTVSYRKFEDIELMQYTGLKDKNNKEIYEGDIVTLHNSRYRIIFNSEEARFVLKDVFFEMDIPFTNNNNKRIEVIGNIYENSELLGEQ